MREAGRGGGASDGVTVGGVLAMNPAEGRQQVRDWAESIADLTPPQPRPHPLHLLRCRYGTKGSAGRSVSPHRGFDSGCVCVCVLNRIMLFKRRNVSGVLRA